MFQVFTLLPVIFCVLLIVCCIVCFFIYGEVFFYCSNIFHRFVYDVFVVADKSNVICILQVNYAVGYGVFVLFYAVIVVMKVFYGCWKHIMCIIIIMII